MRRFATIGLTIGVAVSAALLFLIRTDRVRLADLLPSSSTPVAPSVCKASYFGNQCDGGDLRAIMAAGDYAFRGRGVESAVAFTGVRSAAVGRATIAGRRAEADVICVTGDSALARTAEFELTYGAPIMLSGLIDRRSGTTLYLTHCTYWRSG
jgi:hypothetical protein